MSSAKKSLLKIYFVENVIEFASLCYTSVFVTDVANTYVVQNYLMAAENTLSLSSNE